MARRIYRVIEAPEVERRLRVASAEPIDLWLTDIYQVLTLDPVTEGGPHQIAYIRDAAAYRLQAEAASGSMCTTKRWRTNAWCSSSTSSGGRGVNDHGWARRRSRRR